MPTDIEFDKALSALDNYAVKTCTLYLFGKMQEVNSQAVTHAELGDAVKRIIGKVSNLTNLQHRLNGTTANLAKDITAIESRIDLRKMTEREDNIYRQLHDILQSLKEDQKKRVELTSKIAQLERLVESLKMLIPPPPAL